MSASSETLAVSESARSAPPADGSTQPSMVVLHRETHAGQRWDASASRFEFARHSSTAAIGLSELAAACTVFPCVIARAGEGEWSLLAVTGLQPGHNLFVDEHGDWEGEYLPAKCIRAGASSNSSVRATKTLGLSCNLSLPRHNQRCRLCCGLKVPRKAPH